MNLSQLEIGESGKVVSISLKGANRQHFLDMGVIPGAIIKLSKYAPLGDPIEYKLHGYTLTLRKDDAKNIKIEKCDEEIEDLNLKRKRILEHPGLGESGAKYHDKKTEKPIDDNKTITFALVGNQNAGKTTLFNQLTGSNQHVGNFPGVTVDRKEGPIRNTKNTLVVDLPGIYSMSPYSPEERVSRDFVLDEKPDGIINVLDATSIERGLYLTMQLLELDIPMVLALNMMDEVKKNDGYIDLNTLEAALGIPVVAISASKNEGIDELISHALHVAKYQEKPLLQDYCDPKDHDGAVHRCLHAIMHLIQDHTIDNNLPLRFCASKAADGDNQIIKKLHLDSNEVETLEHISLQMENERQLDRHAAIADMRYAFIKKISDAAVIRPKESLEETRSNKIDKLLTGRYTAIPSFVLIIGVMFIMSFNIVGPYFENLLENAINGLENIVNAWMINNDVSIILRSLVINGIFEGVGSIISFLPIIIVLFFFLSILEDSGYMARIAFVMDKLLRKIGLSGRSIIPMLVGFGCTVPAIMSARTLPSERDRKMTILLTPFMSCTAKLPIYAYFTHEFFPNIAGLLMVIIYLLGIVLAILVALLFRKTLFKGDAMPFVMELPNYRFPSIKNVGQLLWEKSKDFLERAFTVIFIAVIVVWFLQNFSIGFNFVSNQEESILAYLASYVSVIFKPIGFNSWKITVSLVTGFLAKESVVSTINVLFETKEALHAVISSASAISLLVFSSLYTPCVASIAAVKKEMGKAYALFVIIFQCVIAWIVSFIIYNIVTLFL